MRVPPEHRSPEPPGRLLSVDEAADSLGIAPGTLRNWVAARRIEFVRVGRLTKFTPAQLERYKRSHTVATVKRGE